MTDQNQKLEYDVVYSLHVEKMTERFNRRLDNLITFGLILLGSAIAGSLGNSVLIGILVATFSASQLVWRFGEKAGHAAAQMKRYEQLLSEFNALDDDSVRAGLNALSAQDSTPLTSLENIATRNAIIYLGWYENDLGLTRLEQVLGFFCGATPMPKKPRQGHGGEAQAAHDETPA
ncbi:hypothetical protein [Cobetia sp. MB87]|uniref:hypothetical protein n=1 Tax=Cobetia sp. MB87 TaxID=2588451 RepID=UPI00140AFBF9|nr:hypothetical protein [Cobetia sp. MB87]NHH86533.1 hypothetical protein [Cobetia sp. MB87]